MTLELADQLAGTDTHFWCFPLDEFADPIQELREIQNGLICQSGNIFDHKSTIFLNKDTFYIFINYHRVKDCYRMILPPNAPPLASVHHLDFFNAMMASLGLPQFRILSLIPTGWFMWRGIRRTYSS